MNRKKTILFIAPLPPPTYGSALSSQTCLDVLQSSDDLEIEHIKINYSETFNDVGKVSLKKFIGFFIVLGKITVTSIRFRPDLVYIMPATTGFAFIRDTLFSFLAKMLNSNIIYHFRTRITKNDRRSKLKNFTFKNAFKESKAIILGKELTGDIISYFKKENIFVLPNAILKTITDEEFEVIEKGRLDSKKLRLVFLSNMMKDKGWLKILESARILKDMAVEFTVTFAGSWPSKSEEKEFSDFVEDFDLSCYVNYIGFVDINEKYDLLSNSDILIFPTEYKYETFGRVIIEAMEFGLPVIANNIASIPSTILDNTTGFLLKNNSPDEIAGYITALKNRKDLIEMGKAARERFLSHYELTIFRNKFLKIIKSA
ncbi:glycosyltransferase family 4 protein [Marivirga sp.]|uniref:glycosyltransferase family 4 protein n=1 Tax=Marivirga sp. TaxID=2018662 RepID=UPI0025D3DFEE|nr:glycosyltransferase family 4 protein [Marivirga sp.]